MSDKILKEAFDRLSQIEERLQGDPANYSLEVDNDGVKIKHEDMVLVDLDVDTWIKLVREWQSIQRNRD